ncbi:amidohydrolase family protein [Haloarchaeobius sp. TZWSO28]|uniref:amidohydrolase family protein n=1 Tax=Haloarchaeobius sp. TZWSO28 TaxID=3446119 RepID=UPI003EB8BBF0
MADPDIQMRRQFMRRLERWSETSVDRVAFEADLSDATLIDGHFHFLPDPDGVRSHDERIAAVDETIEWLDEHGVDRVVAQSLDSPEGMHIPTWWTLELAERYPDRIIPFCSVEPRSNTWEGYDWFADRIDEYIDRGARGYGEVKIGMDIDDTRLQMIYDICADRDLPVLFHLDGSHAVDAIGLPGLERMVQKFPDLDFIMHAHGWWAHISGDVTPAEMASYPVGDVAPGGRVDYFLTEYDNVYGDISAGSGFNALTRDPEYGQAFLERHHEKLIWGSDVAGPTDVPQFAFFERFELAPAQWENIRFRNLEAILR